MKNKFKETFLISFCSILVNLVLSLGKVIAGISLKSQTLISDAVHSMSDVLSTVIVIIGTFIANKQADEDHPYGHERYEEIASLLLGSLLFFTGYEVAKSAIMSLITQNYNIDTSNILIGIIVCLISIGSKFVMYLITLIKAKQIESSALKADAYHHLSDSLSSIGGLVGLIFVQIGYSVMDSIAALTIAVFIFVSAFEIIKDATDKLTDKACSDEDLSKIKDIVHKHKNVEIHRLRTRLFSNRIYVDLEIALDSQLTLQTAHETAQQIHDELEDQIPKIKHCLIHVNPKN